MQYNHLKVKSNVIDRIRNRSGEIKTDRKCALHAILVLCILVLKSTAVVQH